ncbi:ATP-binding protein [Cryptosporangium phraense]|uniref:ATP-binding protein n=1 Tax=Cryptosporangium phraense TaxID=2593070 RepID=A0A545AEN8_9ACTN|nr:ATP-binding protein [Cryptosporangium phraense]TQS39796.1 ATP-binding protein [Cryptosporangium phraense]
MTRDACARWSLIHIADATCLVATELVDNAAVHARTDLVLTLLYRAHLLHIAVSDQSATPGRAGGAGNGLRIIEEFASGWGIIPLPDGKVTWATLSIAS